MSIKKHLETLEDVKREISWQMETTDSSLEYNDLHKLLDRIRDLELSLELELDEPLDPKDD